MIGSLLWCDNSYIKSGCLASISTRSLLKRGFRKPLTDADLWSLRPQDRARPIIDRFYRCWRHAGRLWWAVHSKCYFLFKCQILHLHTYFSKTWFCYGRGPDMLPSFTSTQTGGTTSRHSSVTFSESTKNGEETSTPDADCLMWAVDSKVTASLVRTFGAYYAMLTVFEVVNLAVTFLRPLLLEWVPEGIAIPPLFDGVQLLY